MKRQERTVRHMQQLETEALAVSKTDCKSNDASIGGFDINVNYTSSARNLDEQYNLTISPFLWIINESYFYSNVDKFHLCLNVDKKEFCNLNIFDEHKFLVSRSTNQSQITGSICLYSNEDCFCSVSKSIEFPQIVSPQHDLEILSPHNGSELYTDYILLIIQFKKNYFLHYNVCIQWMLFDSKEIIESICYNRFPDDHFSSRNNTFITLNVPDLGAWTIEVLSRRNIDNTTVSTTSSTFTVLSYKSCPHLSITTKKRTVADATFYVPQEEDMHIMRIVEHSADVLILLEGNETHNGSSRIRSTLFPDVYSHDLTSLTSLTHIGTGNDEDRYRYRDRYRDSSSAVISSDSDLDRDSRHIDRDSEVGYGDGVEVGDGGIGVTGVLDFVILVNRLNISNNDDDNDIYNLHLAHCNDNNSYSNNNSSHNSNNDNYTKDSSNSSDDHNNKTFGSINDMYSPFSTGLPTIIGRFIGLYGDIEVNDMVKETMQRNAVCTVLSYIKRHNEKNLKREVTLPLPFPDVTIVADSDEILKRDVVNALRTCPGLSHNPSDTDSTDDITSQNQSKRQVLVIFTLRHHFYNFNRVLEQEWGILGLEGAYAIPSNVLLHTENGGKDSNSNGDSDVHTATRIRRLLRAEYRETLLSIARTMDIVIWRDAGWHLSAFKAPGVQAHFKSTYPKEKNPLFWTEERCETMQPQSRSKVHHILAKAEASYVDINENELPLAAQYSSAIRERYSRRRSSHYDDKDTSLQLLGQLMDEYDASLLAYDSYKYNKNQQAMTSQQSDNNLQGRSIVTATATTATATSHILYNAHIPDTSSSHTFSFRCIDSDEEERLADRIDINNQLCCDTCLLRRISDQCVAVYAYVDVLCRISSNPTVDANIVIPNK
eukprot:gene5163-10324_t